MSRYIVGADVGGTKIAYGLFDEGYRLLESRRYPSDPTLPAEAFADQILAQTGLLLRDYGRCAADLRGLGICMPSRLHHETGLVRSTANLPLLKNVPLRDYLQRGLNAAVLLENDANAAALAEHRHGAGRGCRNLLYCTVSTGLGLGIILDGRLFRGDDGCAGESGHMVANPEEPGDYESHIGGAHIVKRVARRLREGEPSAMMELCGGSPDALDGHHLRTARERGDPLAVWAVDHMGHYLGVWLYNLYQTFNINRIVVGGGLTNLGEALLGPARAAFDQLGGGDLPATIAPAQLGALSGVMGAAELFREHGEAN